MEMDVRGEEGFTLLEVLIALVIVSVGLVAAAGMQSSAIFGNAFAKDTSLAVQLVEEMVERIRINGRDDPTVYNGIDTSGTCSGTDPALGDCTQWQSRIQNSGLASAFGTVTVTNNSPINKTATVSVTLTWGNVRTRTVTFVTVIDTWIT